MTDPTIAQVSQYDRELYTRSYICHFLLKDMKIEELERLLGARIEILDTYKAPDIITFELDNGKEYDVTVRRRLK